MTNCKETGDQRQHKGTGIIKYLIGAGEQGVLFKGNKYSPGKALSMSAFIR